MDIPDAVGTVVLDVDGHAWQRYTDGWSCAAIADEDGRPLSSLTFTYGPLRLMVLAESE